MGASSESEHAGPTPDQVEALLEVHCYAFFSLAVMHKLRRFAPVFLQNWNIFFLSARLRINLSLLTTISFPFV